MAKVIQVIETEVKRGKGVLDDPMRGVTQYWSLDGELLAEHDPILNDGPTEAAVRGSKMLDDLYGKKTA